MTNTEEWKIVIGGCYEISSSGNIRSVTRDVLHSKKKSYYIKKSNPMKFFNNGNGYMYVTTSCNGVRKNVYIHRLVCEAFHERTDGFDYVNHKDGNKSNNHYLNLEWCNHSHNIRHAYKNNLNHTGGKKVNAIKVIDSESGKIFECIKHAADFFNIKYGLLKEALRRTSAKKHPIYKRLSYYNPDVAKEWGLSESRLSNQQN